jgi:hypothetical protein
MYLPPPDAHEGHHTPGLAPPTFLSPPGYTGHAHFWERALSRRQFVRTAAGTTAVVLGAGLWTPSLAAAANPGNDDDDHDHHGVVQPTPIPGGTDLLALLGLPPGPIYHFFFPAFGQEVSTINNLNGSVAAAEIQGTGTAIDTKTGAKTPLTFDADMRFMDGVYVGEDGHTHRGTFGFI